MKKIVFLILILLLSGCASTYNLEISNDNFKEKINVKIDKSEIPSKSIYEEIETDDPITPFLNNDYSALFSDDSAYYEKKVVYYDNYIDVNMTYNYNSEQFKDSNSLNMCFDSFEFNDEENYYIHAYGTFYCLYSDNVTINIKTNNKVIKNNADSVDGNIYTWKIDSSNLDQVDIEFEVSKGFPWKKTLKYGAIIIGVIIIFISAFYYIYNKRKKNNSID